MYHYVTLIPCHSNPTTLIPNPNPEAATVDSIHPYPGPRQTTSSLLSIFHRAEISILMIINDN